MQLGEMEAVVLVWRETSRDSPAAAFSCSHVEKHTNRLKPKASVGVECEHLNLFAEPKRAQRENRYRISSNLDSLAQNNASVLFLGCDSRLYLEVWKTHLYHVFSHK